LSDHYDAAYRDPLHLDGRVREPFAPHSPVAVPSS
jgi:hypothetical protein